MFRNRSTCLATPNTSGPGWVIHVFDRRGAWAESGTKVGGYTKKEALSRAKNIRRRLMRQRIRKLAGKKCRK